MNKSKNFNLFLMDGEVTGRIKCTLLNWTGLAYKIPRSLLDSCKKRQDLKQSGVYFLFFKNEDGQDEVYIGQAGVRKNKEGILYRVLEHLKDEFYFTDVVILTTQNSSFGPTEISFLENKFTNLAKEAQRYIVKNGNEPNPGNVTEEKESELEDFVEYSKMVLGVLGYKIFVPLINNELSSITEEIYSLNSKTKKSDLVIKAKCKRTNEGFVVLKDSMIEMNDSETLPKSIKLLRDTLRENNEIVNGRIIKDYLFNSPSYAAMFILGMSRNGRTEWKNKDGRTLKELDEM